MTRPRNLRRLAILLVSGATAVPTGPCQVVCGENGCADSGGGVNGPPSPAQRIEVQSRDPSNPIHGRTNDVARVDWQTILELNSFDPEDDAILTEWDLDGDGSFEQGGFGETTFGSPTREEPFLPGQRVQTYYHRPGAVDVTARVTDFPEAPGIPGEVIRTRRLFVLDDATAATNHRPVIAFEVSPPSPRAGQQVAVEATARDPDSWEQDLWYAWDFGIPDSYTGFRPGFTRTTHTWESPGTYEVRLDVQDGIGANAILTKNVTVRDRNAANTAPRASFAVRPSVAPMAGQEVTFDASGSSDTEGRIVRYEWDLDGNGSYEVVSAQPITSTSYGSPGERSVGLQVTDEDGATDVERRTINVRPAALTLKAGAPVFPAAAASLRFSARVDGAPRRGSGGRRATGSVRAQFVEPLGRGESRVARRLRRFFGARWQMRISRKIDRRSGRVTASGVALARPRGDRRSAACIRLRVGVVPGEVPSGRLTLLGGTGSAARLRGSARFVFRLERDGGGTVLGPISAREGRARPLPRACRV